MSKRQPQVFCQPQKLLNPTSFQTVMVPLTAREVACSHCTMGQESSTYNSLMKSFGHVSLPLYISVTFLTVDR